MPLTGSNLKATKGLNAVRVPHKFQRKVVKFLPAIDQDIDEEKLHN